MADGTVKISHGVKVQHLHPNMPDWLVHSYFEAYQNRVRDNRLNGPFYTFVLSITDRCNLKCDYCCHPSMNSEIPADEAVDKVREACALDFDEICVTGGEPYLRRSLLYQLASICKDNAKLFGTMSNGYWAKDRTRAFALAQEMIDSGIARVTFSWDPSHGQFIDAQTIQNGVDACMHVGMKVSLAGSFKKKGACHADYGIRVEEHLKYDNFKLSVSPVLPAGNGTQLGDCELDIISRDDALDFRCSGAAQSELVLYDKAGLTMPCCSVHAGYDLPNLSIADWRQHPLEDLVQLHRADPYYRIICNRGFAFLIELIKRTAPDLYARLPSLENCISSCQLCERLMACDDAIAIKDVCESYVLELVMQHVEDNADYFERVLLAQHEPGKT